MNRCHLHESIAATLKRARAAAPAAAMATGLLSAAALGAPGDLDPSFADVGRAYPLPDLSGAAWSIQPQGEDDFIVAGGEYYASYYYDTFYVSGFTGRLSGNGSIDPAFAAFNIADMEVLDAALHTDGSVIGVGRKVLTTPSPARMVLTVFRLDASGVLDTTFGVDGLAQPFPDPSTGSSVIIEPAGRIVVAGHRNGQTIVLRLLANGTLDETFAVAGVFTDDASGNYSLAKIVRMADGGYRVTRQGVDCRVLALTAGGAVDGSFTDSGMSGLESPYTCRSMGVQADGRLLVAGQHGPEEVSEGFVVRLLANGQRDDSFDASTATDALAEATALEVLEGGSIIVGGRTKYAAAADTLVMRLLTSGAFDTTWGNDGSTVIDLPTEYGTWSTINDIAVAGGKVVVAGGASGGGSRGPFVARLLGDDGTDGPGVLGVGSPLQVVANEQDGDAVVTVRRTGGSAGRVSVVVRTRPAASGPFATPGEDYVETEHTLTWEDGDVADKQVVIPLLPDAPDAIPDEQEQFEVALSSVQGGAGLGTRVARITIAADGYPAGQFSIEPHGVQRVTERASTVAVRVRRNFYGGGPVSVTVSPVAGTAVAGQDYTGDPVTMTWAHGEFDDKIAYFRILDDEATEEAEQFSVKLSAPTGGAIIGPHSEVLFTILRNDQTVQAADSGGGGSVGPLALLLLGLAELMRRASGWVARLRRWPAVKTT